MTQNVVLYRGIDSGVPVVVSEEAGIRTLTFGSDAKQSCLDVHKPERLVLAYTQWMMASILLPARLEKVLVLGIGGGSLIRFLLHHHPTCTVDAVDISGIVISLLSDYFLLNKSKRCRIIQDDASCFAAQSPRGIYDLILVDLFEPDRMAPVLFAEEFYGDVRRLLRMDGVMAANFWSGDKKAYRIAKKAAATAFSQQLLAMSVKKRSNTIMLAFPGPIPKSRLRKARKEAALHREKYGLDFASYFKKLRRTNRAMSWII